jgi:hypothetical protein
MTISESLVPFKFVGYTFSYNSIDRVTQFVPTLSTLLVSQTDLVWIVLQNTFCICIVICLNFS